MKRLLILLVLTSLKLSAQQGIHFLKAQSWQQVLDSAKAEHKYIFVDCFTTWCGPCKMMEQEVYPVAGAAYKNFICVKLQMDQTAKDNDTIKAMYPIAAMLQQAYTINAFPSFLFFDENGKVVHKAIGYQEPAAFIQLAEVAKDSTKQFYRLRATYERHTISYPALSVLADEASGMGDENLGNETAKAYIHGYLNQVSDSALVSPQNQAFLQRHAQVITTDDRIFQLCVTKPALVDGKHGGGAFYFACFILNKELIYPQMIAADSKKAEPDWAQIENTFSGKYGSRYVTDNAFLLDDKIGWYKYKKNGALYGHYLALKTTKGSKDSVELVNSAAMEIFKYDTDQKDLQTALAWMQQVNKLQTGAAYLDTEAGLLYKLGRKREALLMEHRAEKLKPADGDLAANYKKMQSGQATWAQQME